MGFIGGYELHLYCDECETVAKIAEHNMNCCKYEARKRGWKVNYSSSDEQTISHGSGYARCPDCANKGKSPTPEAPE